MKVHTAKGGPNRLYNQTVPALFHLTGNDSLYAGDVQDYSTGILEGKVRHVPAAKLPVGVVNLRSCSAVLYCYMNNDDLTDVVAFHSPNGGIHFKSDPTRGNGTLGTPTEEARYYGITGYDGIYVVIANGPETSHYTYGVTDPSQKLDRAIHEGLSKIFDMLKRDSNVSEERILLYERARLGTFGISADKHIGEPGSALRI